MRWSGFPRGARGAARKDERKRRDDAGRRGLREDGDGKDQGIAATGQALARVRCKDGRGLADAVERVADGIGLAGGERGGFGKPFPPRRSLAR